MPFPSIDAAFVKQYEADVHLAYQRQGSKFRGLVRTVNGVVGSTTTFQKIGTGAAVTKGRSAAIPPMNLAHTNVECTLQDWYAGDWYDKLDELKIRHDERMAIANSGAYALGRQTDTMIVNALASAPSGRNVTGSGNLADAATFTIEKVYRGIELLNLQDVPDDGMRFCAVSPQGWSALLNIQAFANSQWAGDNMPFKSPTTQMKSWLGINWFQFPALPATGAIRDTFMWHQRAVGHAIGAEVASDISWHGDRAAWFINNMMSQGAVLIDELGTVRIRFTET
jgi:hypothetical protein